MRCWIKRVLLLFVWVTLGMILYRQWLTTSVGIPALTSTVQEGVRVSYLTTNVRCVSCRKIESMTRDCVARYNQEKIPTPALTLEVINTDLPENRHSKEEYEMTQKTVVLAFYHEGKRMRWIRRDDVWDHLDDAEAFYRYFKAGVDEIISGGQS